MLKRLYARTIGRNNLTINSPPMGMAPVTVDVVHEPLRGFIVTTGGDVVATMFDGSIGYYPNASAGAIYPGLITQVLSSGSFGGATKTTSATGIVGLL
jgi:hypothetical protein